MKTSLFDSAQKKMLALLVLVSVFDGITQGILLLQESIARKALLATDFQITLIGVIANGTLLFSFFVSYFFSGRSKKKLVILGYFLGRFVFAFACLATDGWTFLAFLFLYHGLFAIQIPVLNSFYQSAFGPKRGNAFGIARMVLILFTMGSSFAAGKFLDASPALYWAALSVVAVSGFATYAIILKLETGNTYVQKERPPLRDFLPRIAEISRRRDFMFFETVFMVYGVAFMICVPAVPIFLLSTLKMSYSEMSLAQGIVAQSAVLLLTPFAGKLFDTLNPWKISAFSNLSLLFYPLLLLVSFFLISKGFAFAGLAFYSVGVTGINVLWNMGPAAFSKNEDDAFLLQAFHISLTGVRGIIGPFAGLLLLSIAGVQWNFIISTVLFGAASLLSIWKAAQPQIERRE